MLFRFYNSFNVFKIIYLKIYVNAHTITFLVFIHMCDSIIIQTFEKIEQIYIKEMSQQWYLQTRVRNGGKKIIEYRKRR